MLGGRRFVALKITVADLLDNNREARILKLITENPATDVEGSQHVLGLLDNFQMGRTKFSLPQSSLL
jgi:hypothetical protein